MTIYPDLWDWAEIRGLQIEGQAAAVTDSPLRDRVLRQYRRKFPLPVSLDSRIASSTLYRLTPHWMRWLDNRVSFSYKREFSL